MSPLAPHPGPSPFPCPLSGRTAGRQGRTGVRVYLGYPPRFFMLYSPLGEALVVRCCMTSHHPTRIHSGGG